MHPPLPLEHQKMLSCKMCCSDPCPALLILSLKCICILHTRKEEMILKLIKKILFLFMTVLGIMGNMSVSVNYMFSCWGSPEKKPVHLILIHLAFTNTVILLAKGLPKTIVAFGLRNFLDDSGCKIIVYLERVAHGLSLCASSLLTVVQAIIISPRASGWRMLRPKSAWHILPFFLFFWLFSALINMNLINSITSTRLNISQFKTDSNNCYFMLPSQKIKGIVLPLMVLRDAVFQGAMGGASGYMVFLLYKHHQHVLYLQNSKLLYRTPPELRAAQSVLLLMFCFVFFYWTDCAFSLILSLSSRDNTLMVNPRELLTLGYATFSPLVLIHRDGLLVERWHVQWEKLRKCLLFICSTRKKKLSVLQYCG
uniref:Vomeronasal type-1 receptor n=1 Tax=Mus musculus musculus TaxID=39442 RepID=F6MCK4_MOUSE|nr:vomeronasal type 1 receptor H4 [Mus musculus musculus]AEF00641.1 vomeronasal type 1 receptor H4 [Mus musculus musculus]AEF00642.1 vomeronasal type 1 receptor H4 [Mus musculus musculus]AEF00643.1 vomeronasal type 1 receptor H4 [Mus musculus musculus]AEF00644.1 vomeronasal type 1 receptor H4 [Mus musculus musculus]